MHYSDNQKVILFEYMMFRLLEWRNDNSLPLYTRIEALKLLFFTTAASIQVENETSSSENLTSIFDNFYAMQHGPVEGDIYNAMVQNSTRFYDFTTLNTTIKGGSTPELFNELDSNYIRIADNAVDKLKELNNHIVHYEPFQLVDISHKWNSWNIAFQMATILDKRSKRMDNSSIITDSADKNLYYL